MYIRDLGEFPLIARLTAGRGHSSAVLVGPGDDAAVVTSPEARGTLLTCDAMVEGVHFLRVADPFDVGYKLMTANISDIAAMGGTPLYALITLVLPPDTKVQWVDLLYEGISTCADEHGVSVVGGDVSSGSSIVLNAALMGSIDPDRSLLRSAARPGDLVMVTGPLGAARVGLEIHTGALDASGILAEQALRRHHRPVPKVAEGKALAAIGCRAANDISDGLASEVWEIAQASGVAIIVDAALVPVHPAVSLAASDPCGQLEYALYSGEEYELVFTVDQSIFKRCGPSLEGFICIGTVREGQGAHLLRNGVSRPLGRGHVHFYSGDKTPDKE